MLVEGKAEVGVEVGSLILVDRVRGRLRMGYLGEGRYDRCSCLNLHLGIGSCWSWSWKGLGWGCWMGLVGGGMTSLGLSIG